MGSEKVVEITDANFDKEVVGSTMPVLVDFWAEWCMPCRMQSAAVEEIAGEYDGKLKVGSLNTDDNRQIAAQMGISAIPTLLIFKDGQIVKKFVGLRSKRDLKEEIDSILE